ncbi:MAG: ATP-binding cassette domain-containing protein [Clostridiales bacterium]|nr:ATP-binding cassette domain-containing protein [Clostridiales bacterium]
MIDISKLTCIKNNTTILKDIHFSVHSKERIAIIGPSGAGKTTLMTILSKQEEDYTGSILVNNKDIKTYDHRELSHLVGSISQEMNLIDNLKVIHNVLAGKLKDWSFIKSVYSLFIPQEKQAALQALSSVHLEGHYDKKTSDLSGGEKQRVAIARLLMQNPLIVLADEPIASLDPSLARNSIELLLSTTQDKTLIMVLHHVDYALEYFDRIIAIKNGEVYFDKKAIQVSQEDLGALYEL